MSNGGQAKREVERRDAIYESRVEWVCVNLNMEIKKLGPNLRWCTGGFGKVARRKGIQTIGRKKERKTGEASQGPKLWHWGGQ